MYEGIGGNDDIMFEYDSEEEGYIFAGQDGDTDNDVEINNTGDASATTSSAPDPYDHVYSNIPPTSHKLKPVENCKYCGAKKFEYESRGFCCRNEKIKLSSPDTPPEFMRLWSSADANSRHFCDNIRFFNSHFSFTSLLLSP